MPRSRSRGGGSEQALGIRLDSSGLCGARSRHIGNGVRLFRPGTDCGPPHCAHHHYINNHAIHQCCYHADSGCHRLFDVATEGSGDDPPSLYDHVA